MSFRLFSPERTELLREQIIAELGLMEKKQSTSEIGEREQGLARVEERIANVVSALARGVDSDYVRADLSDSEQ